MIKIEWGWAIIIRHKVEISRVIESKNSNLTLNVLLEKNAQVLKKAIKKISVHDEILLYLTSSFTLKDRKE